jgi:hypothetical protein
MSSCEYCGASLECRRQGTRFCDGSCRAKAWLRDHPERDYRTRRRSKPRINVTSGPYEPSTKGTGPAHRRPSRDGREYPLDFEGPVLEHADLLDEWSNEPIIWLASHGYLSPEEIAAITEDANVARPRIGTDGERIGSGGVDWVDVRAVKLYEAVTDALKPNPPP